jgi:hypothetical protein
LPVFLPPFFLNGPPLHPPVRPEDLSLPVSIGNLENGLLLAASMIFAANNDRAVLPICRTHDEVQRTERGGSLSCDTTLVS